MNLQSPKLRRTLQILLGLYWLLIFTLTHIPAGELPPVRISDKIEHLLAYGALGGFLFLNLWIFRPSMTQIGIVVLAIGMMYGAVDEWLQIPVHRDCDLLDWFADTTGVAIAVVCMTVIRYRSTKSQSQRISDLKSRI